MNENDKRTLIKKRGILKAGLFRMETFANLELRTSDPTLIQVKLNRLRSISQDFVSVQSELEINDSDDDHHYQYRQDFEDVCDLLESKLLRALNPPPIISNTEDDNYMSSSNSEHRKLEKATPDNAMALQRQTLYRRSGSLSSEMQRDENRTKNDFKYKNGFELKDDPKMQSISIRNWHSAELPTLAEQRTMSSDCLKKEPESSTSPSFTNEHNNFHRSASQSSSLSAPASTEELPSCSRHLSPSNPKSLSSYGSSSLSRESSIEEGNEILRLEYIRFMHAYEAPGHHLVYWQIRSFPYDQGFHIHA
jgi:hypothetical protein